MKNMVHFLSKIIVTNLCSSFFKWSFWDKKKIMHHFQCGLWENNVLVYYPRILGQSEALDCEARIMKQSYMAICLAGFVK